MFQPATITVRNHQRAHRSWPVRCSKSSGIYPDGRSGPDRQGSGGSRSLRICRRHFLKDAERSAPGVDQRTVAPFGRSARCRQRPVDECRALSHGAARTARLIDGPGGRQARQRPARVARSVSPPWTWCRCFPVGAQPRTGAVAHAADVPADAAYRPPFVLSGELSRVRRQSGASGPALAQQQKARNAT